VTEAAARAAWLAQARAYLRRADPAELRAARHAERPVRAAPLRYTCATPAYPQTRSAFGAGVPPSGRQ
jgi:hypothetical protein